MNPNELKEQAETMYRMAHCRQPYYAIIEIIEARLKEIFEKGMKKGTLQSKELQDVSI